MKTTNDIQKENLAAQQEGAWLQEQEAENSQNSELSKVLQYLAPWIEKTDGEESVGSWETTLATKMMVKLLELWLTWRAARRWRRCWSFIIRWTVRQWRMRWWCM